MTPSEAFALAEARNKILPIHEITEGDRLVDLNGLGWHVREAPDVRVLEISWSKYDGGRLERIMGAVTFRGTLVMIFQKAGKPSWMDFQRRYITNEKAFIAMWRYLVALTVADDAISDAVGLHQEVPELASWLERDRLGDND